MKQTIFSDEQIDRIVGGMCMTYRHDFGLDKHEDDVLGCGMTEIERRALIKSMRQIFMNDMIPLFEEMAAGAKQGWDICDSVAQALGDDLDRDAGSAVSVIRMKQRLKQLEQALPTPSEMTVLKQVISSLNARAHGDAQVMCATAFCKLESVVKG